MWGSGFHIFFCFLAPPNKTYAFKNMDALNTFCEVLFFYLNSLVLVGKEFWCKCDFCKSCCQTLVLVKVLSGLLLSQQEKKNKIYPNQLNQKYA